MGKGELCQDPGQAFWSLVNPGDSQCPCLLPLPAKPCGTGQTLPGSGPQEGEGGSIAGSLPSLSQGASAGGAPGQGGSHGWGRHVLTSPGVLQTTEGL